MANQARGRCRGGGVRVPETRDYIPPRARLPILALCLKEHIDRATLSHRPRDLIRRFWLLFERYVPSSCDRSVSHDARFEMSGHSVYLSAHPAIALGKK